MEKSIMPKGEFQKVAPAFMRNGKQHYFLRILAKEVGEDMSFVEEVFDHEPTKADEDALFASILAKEKSEAVVRIMKYDSSDAVNGFKINGEHGWADKATRVGLHNSISIEKEAGAQTTVIYLNGKAYTLPVNQALQMLASLELYAIDCYRKTEEHKAAVEALADPDEVQLYDYTAGYPQQLEFEV
jgi:hypothetical protein